VKIINSLQIQDDKNNQDAASHAVVSKRRGNVFQVLYEAKKSPLISSRIRGAGALASSDEEIVGFVFGKRIEIIL
jgi:hypothetical protein